MPKEQRPGETLAAHIRANRALPLGRYLRGLARASALASVLAGSACDGDDSLAEWIPSEEAILPLCDENRWLSTEGLDPVVADYDYLAVALCGGQGCNTIGSVGTPCVTDGDPSDCAREVEEERFGNGVTLTRGSEVVVYPGSRGLVEFLGEVNTPQEAILVAYFDWFFVRCDDPQFGAARLVADGYEVVATKLTEICDPIVETRFLLHVGSDGQITELDSQAYSSEYGFCIGRRPSGLRAPNANSRHTVAGQHFAGIATLEAAAVIAFDRLAADLAALGAPDALIDDARAAARDEARHAKIMGDVARHFGAEPEAPEVAPAEPRDLYAIALENGVEGCVRETFGALTGCYQGLHAKDPHVAAAMRSVSDDEIRHADLSHRVDSFLHTLLTPTDRTRLATAKRAAIAELRSELEAPRSEALVSLAGHPHPALASRWLDRLEQDLWQC